MPHAGSELTSSKWLSPGTASALEAGCWAAALSVSGSISDTAAALGSDTSLEKEESRCEDFLMTRLKNGPYEVL